MGIKTGDDGSFSFVVHDGLSYVAHASHWDEAERKQVRGNVGPFVAASDLSVLKVVLTEGR